jgi:diphthine-ammonia ligase
MKVVALISGGKDSTMNMLQCIAHGHQIAALANLYPQSCEELDSYMYQSVGHDAIEAFARCAQLPLYRRAIVGTPLNQGFDYVPTENDEVEDLYNLLKLVKEKHPDVEAVSSGAIHSTYQKNRVENVCARLGLVSLAFLWNADQPTLLQQMIDVGLEAVIIKTAVIGLGKPDLGKTIKELQPKLLALKEEYGVNVCGEGGEYETLTLNCPLFEKERIEITEKHVVVHKECSFAPVVFLKIVGVSVVPK